MTDSDYLWQMYNRFTLNLGGKRVPTPYRINLPYQPDRRLYGKWNPSKLTHDTKIIAQEKGVDLNKLTAEEIRQFMQEQMLGIDCSGFAYQMLNFLLNKLGKGNMRQNGFPPASSTNVKLLKSDQFSLLIEKTGDAKVGDVIAWEKSVSEQAHVVVIMEINQNEIIFTHSSDTKENNGVQTGKILITDPEKNIKDQSWPNNLNQYLQLELGDGIRRLIILA